MLSVACCSSSTRHGCERDELGALVRQLRVRHSDCRSSSAWHRCALSSVTQAHTPPASLAHSPPSGEPTSPLLEECDPWASECTDGQEWWPPRLQRHAVGGQDPHALVALLRHQYQPWGREGALDTAQAGVVARVVRSLAGGATLVAIDGMADLA